MPPTDTREPLKDGVTRITSGRTGKVSYEARWSWQDAAGKRQQGRETFSTLKAARSHRARVLTELAESRYQPASRLTVAAFVEQWMARRQRDWASSTTYTRKRQWLKHIEPRLGGLRITNVTRHHCQTMADELARQYKPANVKSVMAMVTAIFGAAETEGLVHRNVAAGLDLPAVRSEPRPHWTPDQARQFLDATISHVDHVMYTLLLTTGVRIGEAIALRWSQVDFDRGTIQITDTLRRDEDGRYHPESGTKTTKDRVVAMSPECHAALTAHQARQVEQRREAPVWDIRGYVFTSAHRGDGRNVDYTEFSRRLRVALQRSDLGDLPKITAHGMRHSVSTILYQGDVDPVTRSAMLGHSIQVAMQTYSHHGLADLQRASAVIGERLGTTKREEKVQNDG